MAAYVSKRAEYREELEATQRRICDAFPAGHRCAPCCLVCTLKASLLARLRAGGVGGFDSAEQEPSLWRAMAELIVEGKVYDIVEPDGRVLFVLTAEGSR